MLEQPKKSGGKLVSHILASHGGKSKFSIKNNYFNFCPLLYIFM